MSDDNVETVETTEVKPPEPVLTNSVTDPFESRARRMGWVGKDEFRGDGGAQWVDAETFISRAEKSADILIERNKALDRRLEQSEKVFGDYKKTSEEQLTGMAGQLKELQETLVDFRNFASTASERAYKKARTELEAEMRQAVTEADINKFERAKSQVDELDKEAAQNVREKRADAVVEQPRAVEQPVVKPVEQAAAPLPPPPPEVGAWLARNQWFINPDFSYMNQFAQRMHMKLLNEEPGLSLSQNLEKVTEVTKRKFPEEFGINPRREEVSAVTTSNTTTAKTKKAPGYDDLPAEAKAACDRYVRNIPGYSIDEYVKVYFSGEEE